MIFKIGDILDLCPEVSAVVYAIEYNSAQIRYQLHVVRRDNGCEFQEDLGYNSKSGKWYESYSGMFGGKYWRPLDRNIPTINNNNIKIPIPKINIFRSEEPERD